MSKYNIHGRLMFAKRKKGGKPAAKERQRAAGGDQKSADPKSLLVRAPYPIGQARDQVAKERT